MNNNNFSVYYSAKEYIQEVADNQPFPYKTSLDFTPLLNKLREDEPNMLYNQSALEELSVKLNAGKSAFEKNQELLLYKDCFDRFFASLFPLLFQPDLIGWVSAPFYSTFIYATSTFHNLLSNTAFELEGDTLPLEDIQKKQVMHAAHLILNRHYKTQIELEFGDTLTVRNKKNLLEEHYQLKSNQQFIEVIPTRPLKEISQRQVHELLNNQQDIDVDKWLELFPPENFEFKGLSINILKNITDETIIASFKDLVANHQKLSASNPILLFEPSFRSFLKIPDLSIGIIKYPQADFLKIPAQFSLAKREDSSDDRFPNGSLYQQLTETGQTLIVNELSQLSAPTPTELLLLQKGYKSLMLIPLHGMNKQIVSILELATPNAFSFNTFHLMKLKRLQALFNISMSRTQEWANNEINLLIQEQFTSVHSSVQWRFREAAAKIMEQRMNGIKAYEREDIVFKNIFPIYGQTDIVGSSTLRNQHIQDDILESLQLLIDILDFCFQETHFFLLRIYIRKAEQYIKKLQQHFTSSDEVEILVFLSEEAHPLLNQLMQRYKKQLGESISTYFEFIDCETGMVYKKRKAYEQSVEILNQTIAHYLEEEDTKMQSLLPHYFEHFKTDGIEYNIYLGESIAPNKQFSLHSLKNFRLWQLVHMCEITQLVARTQKNLPVELNTAQLIFVYGSTLNISFRMDEKKFDVDGAYNVRYEIIKKRIDKATIKGTNERLTQSGKIAIVYLQDKDRMEYLEYLRFLQQENYITGQIEELILENLPGAEGLNALRVEVVMDRHED